MQEDHLDSQLSSDYLLRRILEFYANPKNWSHEQTTTNGIWASRFKVNDPYRLAQNAIKASFGQLISIFCDSRGIALTSLFSKAQIDQNRMYSIICRSQPTQVESIILKKTIDLIL